MLCLLDTGHGVLTLLFVCFWDSALQILAAEPRAGLGFLLSASGVRILSHRYLLSPLSIQMLCLCFRVLPLLVVSDSPLESHLHKQKQAGPMMDFPSPQSNLEGQLLTDWESCHSAVPVGWVTG